PDALLVGHVDKGAVTKDVRQAVWAGIGRLADLGGPKVPPPSHKCQRKETRNGSNCEGCCQDSSSHAPNPASQVLADRWDGYQLSITRSAPRLRTAERRVQSKYRCSVPLRRTSKVTQWGPPPNSLECRNFSGMTSRPSFSNILMSVG